MHLGKRLACCLGIYVGCAQPAFAQDEYVFAFPPREGEARATEVYGPIADYLGKVTGKRFVLKYTDNWLSYQSAMQRDQFDLVFDGPQFIGWRMAKFQHAPLVKLEGEMVFAVVIKKNNDRVKQIKDLNGRKVCGLSPPNLATLTLFDQFDNPVRQPVLMRAQSFREAFDDVIAGRCEAVVMQAAMVGKFDRANETQMLFKSKPVPQQGFTASPRMPRQMQNKIREALLSPGGRQATARMRAEYNNKELVPADRVEYRGMGGLLRDVWGFDL
jgi:ABC-type phosphate/phosphonate transport system substrate-binding protein